MQDKKHPFEELPDDWQRHPVVQSAWLRDLSRRLNADMPRRPERLGWLQPETVRMVILVMLALTATGVIKPEILIKLLPMLFKLSVGLPA